MSELPPFDYWSELIYAATVGAFGFLARHYMKSRGATWDQIFDSLSDLADSVELMRAEVHRLDLGQTEIRADLRALKEKVDGR